MTEIICPHCSGEISVTVSDTEPGPALTMPTCAGCDGSFPERALNYSSGDPFCANCQERYNQESAER